MTSSFVANDLEDSDAPSVAFRIAKHIILVQIPPSILNTKENMNQWTTRIPSSEGSSILQHSINH